MRILSWNLGAAFGRWRDEPDLHDRAWHWIASVDPDIAFLQETRPPTWAAGRWQIQTGHYEFFATALVSRPTLRLRPVVPVPGGTIDRFGSYLATAELALDDGASMLVASVHTSAKVAWESSHPAFDSAAIARTTVGEPWWNDVAFAAYRELVAGRRFLIAGDWNTARWLDENGVPNPPGQEFFDRAGAAGWVDVSLDAEGREGRTWFGATNPRQYQPDHAFVDPVTAQLARSFRIEPWPVETLGLSDHAPLLIEIDLQPTVAGPSSIDETETEFGTQDADDH